MRTVCSWVGFIVHSGHSPLAITFRGSTAGAGSSAISHAFKECLFCRDPNNAGSWALVEGEAHMSSTTSFSTSWWTAIVLRVPTPHIQYLRDKDNMQLISNCPQSILSSPTSQNYTYRLAHCIQLGFNALSELPRLYLNWPVLLMPYQNWPDFIF